MIAIGKQYYPEYLKALIFAHFCSIFMWDMFLILNTAYFTGYVNDNTSFGIRDNIADVIKVLEKIGENSKLVFE